MREVISVPFFLLYPFFMASCKAMAYSNMASWNPSTNMLTWNGRYRHKEEVIVQQLPPSCLKLHCMICNSHNGFYCQRGSKGQAPPRWNLQYFSIILKIFPVTSEHSSSHLKLLAGLLQGPDWSPLIGPWLVSDPPLNDVVNAAPTCNTTQKNILLQVCPVWSHIIIQGIIIVKCVTASSFNYAIKRSVK